MPVKNLTYNSYGQKYQVPRVLVSSLKELQKGDHCALHRNGAYWHHFIVEDIDHEAGEIHAIEYTNTPKGFSTNNCIPPKEFGIAKVVKNIYKFQDEDVYLLKHDDCLNPDDVVLRAQKEVGERDFNPFTNNCEHLAMRCKTGTSSSDQINKAKEMLTNPPPLETMAAIGAVLANKTVTRGGQEVVKTTVRSASKQVLAHTVSKAGQEAVKTGIQVASKETVVQTVSKVGQEVVKTGIQVASKDAVAQTASKVGQEVVKTGIRVASKEAVVQTTSKMGQEVVKTGIHQATKEVLTQTGSNSGQTIIKTMARKTTEEVLIRTGTEAGQEVVKTGVREVSEEVVTQTVSQPATGLGSSLAAGALCAAAFEGLQITCDIRSAHADMKAGKIGIDEFKTVAEKRVITGAGNVGGSTVGTVIGQFLIPVPFVGGAVGAYLGGVAGKYFGNIMANSLL